MNTNPIILELRRIRKSRRILQDELAKRAGYHENTLSEWETGTKDPRFSSLCNWAEALGYKLLLVADHDEPGPSFLP